MSLLSDIGAETRVQINAKANEVTTETDNKISDLRKYLDDQDTLNFNLLSTEITNLDELKASKIELQNEIDTLRAYIDAADNNLASTKMDIVVAESKLADMTKYVDAADTLLEDNKADKTELTAAVNALTDKINLDISTLLAEVIQRDADLDAKNIDVAEFQAAMDAEVLTRTTNDETLQSNIDTEQARAEGIELGLRTDLDAEIQRSITKDNEIDATIQALDDRLEASKADLSYVNAEIQRIDNKDNEQDTELTRLEDVKADKIQVQQDLLDLDNKNVDVQDFEARNLIVDNNIQDLTQEDIKLCF